MREIITLHMGQTGVQLGHAIWELACLEHCVSPTGEFNAACGDGLPCEGLESVFLECTNGNYCPRALLLDLEPTVIDEVRTGAYRQLWNPVNLISGQQDAASNYARAYFGQSRAHLPRIRDRLRVLCEQCDALTCFQLCYSANGGTGSGLTAALCDDLSDLYAKKFKFATSVYPSPTYSEITVEPYNALLHTATTVDLCDCVVLADNEAVHAAISRNLGERSTGFTLPNRVLARLINAQFLCHRYAFLGQQRVEVSDLLTNLVPFPRVHFPTMAFAPFVRREALAMDNFNATQLLSQVFYNDNCHLASINAANQPYIACAVLYRGAVAPCDVVEAVKTVRLSDRTRFVDWCPTGFKLGTNPSPPISMPADCPLKVGDRSLALIASNVGVRDAWYTTRRHFDLLYNKRAFVHWFIAEGMEEGEFMEAADVISSIIQDYEDVGRELKAGSRAAEEAGGPDEDVASTGNHAATVAPRSRSPAPSITRRKIVNPMGRLRRPSTVVKRNYQPAGPGSEGRQRQHRPCALASLSTSNDLRLTSSSSGGRLSLTEGSPSSAPTAMALSYGKVQTTAYASVLQHLQDLSVSTEGDRGTPSEGEEDLFSQSVGYRQRTRQLSFRSRRAKPSQQSPEVNLPLVGHPLVSWAEEEEEMEPARNFTAANDGRRRRSKGDRGEQLPAHPLSTTRTSNWPASMDTNCSAAIRGAGQHAPPETLSPPTTTDALASSSFTRVRFYSPTLGGMRTTTHTPTMRPVPKPRRKVTTGPRDSAGSNATTANDYDHDVGGGGCRPITADCEIPSGIFSRTSTCSIWNTPQSCQGDNGSNTFRTITSLSGGVSSNYTGSVDDVSFTLAYASTSSSSPWFSESDVVFSKYCEVENDDDDDAPKPGFCTQTPPRCQMDRNNSGTTDICDKVPRTTLRKRLPRKRFFFTTDLKAYSDLFSSHQRQRHRTASMSVPKSLTRPLPHQVTDY